MERTVIRHHIDEIQCTRHPIRGDCTALSNRLEKLKETRGCYLHVVLWLGGAIDAPVKAMMRLKQLTLKFFQH
jgi:hypothetical protein